MPVMREQLFTIDKLIEYTKERVRAYTQTQSKSTAMDGDFKLKQITQKYLESCAFGDIGDKMYTKQTIRRMITNPNDGNAEDFPNDYCVKEANIDRFIDWRDPNNVNAYILFLALLLHYKETMGADALGYLIEKYGFNNLRERPAGEGVGFYIDEADVRDMWEREGIAMEYTDKLEVLLQLVYEETFGNSCLDEILYQNVGDISAGVSGIPDSVSVFASDINIPAYKTCWVRYKGSSIHFMFTSFGSNERLKEVAKKSVGYNMRGQFSEKEGFKLGYGKDGSRRTAAIEPFGECPALWVRKFTEQAATNEDLYGGIPGWELVMEAERALIRGGATVPVCGAQGSGKTTKLESLARYVQNFYSIRVLESEFEARLRWKYPLKNIYTMEANETTDVKPGDAYNFSLRSAGDVYIIGEARSDDMIINVTRTANRGGRSVLFTFHPKTAAMTIPEIANAMIREKMYSNLKDAVATALNTVKVCIFVTVDVETHRHFYEIYEFVPRPNVIPKDFAYCTGDERQVAFMEAVHAYMQTMASADTYYDTVPIVVYDRITERYVMQNTVSDSFYHELMEKTPRREEVLELMRVFRPDDFIAAMAQKEGVEADAAFRERMVSEHNLEPRFCKGADV